MVLAACFAPSPRPDLPCTPDVGCPGDQVCDPGLLICVDSIGPADASTDPPDATIDPPDADPAAPDAAPGAWGTPMWLGSVVNSATQDVDPCVTADQLELYFASDRPGGTGSHDLYVSTRAAVSMPWGVPVPILALNTIDEDLAPDISPDGLELYFVSNRATGATNANDFYRATRPDRAAAWTVPALDTALSSGANDAALALSDDRLRVFVDHSGGLGQAREIYERTRLAIGLPWTAEVHHAVLGSMDQDASPTVDANELVIYFKTDRFTGATSYDLVRSTRPSLADPFAAPELVVEVNTASGSDSNPQVSGDDQLMWFSTNRNGGLGQHDLWMAAR